MARENFQRSLRELQDSVLAMGSMVDQAIQRSTQALRARDVRQAGEVIAGDQAINEERFRIEEQALLLIATQAPMARDLRWLAAVLNIITDLERMADHAAGNARITILIGDEPPLKPLIDIPRMADICSEMLRAALDAFVAADADAAYTVAYRDDEVDQLYDQVYRELLTFMMADPGTINRATHLLWAAHNLERIADRVTNICERVVFLSTGHMEEIKGQAARAYDNQ
ncbi:MAG TPA: phosphate signaling complex protein PhoU [Chloroflexia bacterium]|nr:phosphate signaling complex protein PhoU [Chloroflexia bacterium]